MKRFFVSQTEVRLKVILKLLKVYEGNVMITRFQEVAMVWLCLWLVYLGSSSSHQPVRIKTQGQKWGEDSPNQHYGQ
ncbi:hypothetical protein SKZB199_0990 [Streptococcus sp. ZB199]|nr:hypothetical protein SKZB199_0990 [Streptococcus sp. ZB199]